MNFKIVPELLEHPLYTTIIVSRITKYAIEILLNNKNRKDQAQYQYLFDLQNKNECIVVR
jgi:hypothetical protein